MRTLEPASITLGTVDDLPQIYADMEKQFPPDEMYKYKNLLHLLHGDKYKILLYKRNSDGELLGYALVYTVENCNILWLDYIAILKEHQTHGYGAQLFNALWHKYCGPYDGILFSLEHISKNNPSLAKRQELRIQFYEKVGAYGCMPISNSHAKTARFPCIYISSLAVDCAPSAAPCSFRRSAKFMNTVFTILHTTKSCSPISNQQSWTNGFFQHAVPYCNTPLRPLCNPFVVRN